MGAVGEFLKDRDSDKSWQHCIIGEIISIISLLLKLYSNLECFVNM